MKPIKFANLLVLGIVLTFAAAGCRHKPVNVTQLPNAGLSGNPADAGPGNALTNAQDTGSSASSTGIPLGPGHPDWPQNREILAADTVHFDYDRSTVKPAEKPKVAAVAEYLKSNPANAVLIEGHCDERGTEEYNHALGERRALALREALVGLGIDPSRVDTISYGKDRPVDTGRSEAAHAKNRRGEFIVLTPPNK